MKRGALQTAATAQLELWDDFAEGEPTPLPSADPAATAPPPELASAAVQEAR
jgi:hypothetical protein